MTAPRRKGGSSEFLSSPTGSQHGAVRTQVLVLTRLWLNRRGHGEMPSGSRSSRYSTNPSPSTAGDKNADVFGLSFSFANDHFNRKLKVILLLSPQTKTEFIVLETSTTASVWPIMEGQPRLCFWSRTSPLVDAGLGCRGGSSPIGRRAEEGWAPFAWG